jgi:fermentation-respiration switch protein FrsA (DUF1100 family)
VTAVSDYDANVRSVECPVEDGTILRGKLFTPGHGPAPLVVMAHGFSGVVEQIQHYAQHFAEHGLSALVFDHRGFGLSDGSPRGEVDPAQQVSDWRDVIDVALEQPEVDASLPLGVWGSSFAGGLAMVLAASDQRVGCVVAQIPNVGGHHNGGRLFSPPELEELNRRFLADRAARRAGQPPAMLPVFATEPNQLCALPPAVSPRYVSGTERAFPTWRNEVTLRSVENMLTFEPAGWIAHVSPTPLMMIVGVRDACTFPDNQLATFNSLREPKRLVLHPGGHFDPYLEHFEQTSSAAAEWFAEHLGRASSRPEAVRAS